VSLLHSWLSVPKLAFIQLIFLLTRQSFLDFCALLVWIGKWLFLKLWHLCVIHIFMPLTSGICVIPVMWTVTFLCYFHHFPWTVLCWTWKKVTKARYNFKILLQYMGLWLTGACLEHLVDEFIMKCCTNVLCTLAFTSLYFPMRWYLNVKKSLTPVYILDLLTSIADVPTWCALHAS